jgi:hypothetical protein
MNVTLIGISVATLDAEDHRLGHAVDDRTDHDPHRPTRAFVPELALDDAIADEEDRHAGEHAERQLP